MTAPPPRPIPSVAPPRPPLPTSPSGPTAPDGSQVLTAAATPVWAPVAAPVAAPPPVAVASGGGVPLPRTAPQQPPVAVPAVAPIVAPVAAPAVAVPLAGPAAAVPPVALAPTHVPVSVPAASAPGVVEVTDDAETQIVLDDLLAVLVDTGGSDLHLSVGSPPVVRVRGDMQTVSGYDVLTPAALQATIFSILTNAQRQQFEQRKELDLAYTIPGRARFRVNVMRQQGHVGAVMRVIPAEIKALEDLNVPAVVGSFTDLPRGFVLVTGPTGSGKTTTLAAMVDKANRTRRGHIITIEDPVEFKHQHRGCVVNQREVGTDTDSFADALKHVLRQDPDIILVGELRDLETISVALTAAETGHLVFATLHTQSAQETVSRIVDVFPPEQQQQVRQQLAASLRGVVCQTLCKTADGKGRVAAVEVMVVTPAISNLIREGKLQQMQSNLQAGGEHGMQTLNQDLAALVLDGRITYETGLEKCSNHADFNDLVGGPAGAAHAQARAHASTSRHLASGAL